MLKLETERDHKEEIRNPDEDGTDVLVQDYSDIEIEMLESTRKNFLTWKELL